LIDAGFFNGIAGTGAGSTIDRFDELLDTFQYFGRDGQLLIVNESELKIDTVAYKIFTEQDKLKLNGIESGAQVNVNTDWLESDPNSDRYLVNRPNIVPDYIDDTNFEVLKTVDKSTQQTFEATDLALVKARGTELYAEGVPSINADPTKFDISAVTLGQIKDLNEYYSITYGGGTAIPIDNLAASSTYVYLDNTGTLQQQTTVPVRREYYTKLFLARFATNGIQIVAFERLRNPSGQYANNTRELYEYLVSAGVPLKQGLIITPNANLTYNRSAGSVFKFGAGNDLLPNTPEFLEQTPSDFFMVTRNSQAVTKITNLPVTQYDNNGTLTDLTNNNKFVAHRVYFFTSGNTVIQYGQVEYNSLAEAEVGATTSPYIVAPVNSNGLFLGWWIVNKTATDLSDPLKAVFKTYLIGGTGASASAGALLSANNLTDVQNAVTALLNIGGESFINKQNSMDVDGTGTKFPTVDTVNAALSFKQNVEPDQITITTTGSVTTGTLGNLGKTQKGKNVIIDNGVNAINITVNGGTDFLASYLKHGTGAITFVQGAGRTLTQVDATAVLNGAVGSTASISSVGTTDYLRISNAV
jgi:hypothetical protein